ncbi:MAG TPA: indolepyruvate ferredoxin oxidoreductase family protein [Acetobacteraceae bacterium]|nr:indolepyruvate ferredoxin oxidoreductase family protein [Acetobacteraceae bacterium]
MDIGLGRLADLTLDSRYADLDAPVLLSGVQALVRVLLEQARLDRAAGRRTAGLVSGYRGSPLGGLDQELWRHQTILAAHDVRFQPGVNEDLAATMLWGAQQIDAFPNRKVDGVFGMWYGKGPGVDRSGDALHCATMLGTSALGGVLAVAGDDHGAHSSTYPHQTEQLFAGWFIPVLNPASVQDIVDFGLAGIALSRFSGLWIALKTTAETAEQSATITIPAARGFVRPDFPIPPHGLNYDPRMSFPADRIELERRVMNERLPAVLAWARANRLDRVVSGAADAPIGLVTVGKAHTDALHALRRMGLAGNPQLALYKVGLTWPLETEGLRDFARGKRAILVIEEKRSFVEAQIRDALYNLPADERPEIGGKVDARGAPLLSPLMELTPEDVGAALARFLTASGLNVPEPPAAPRPQRPAGLLRRTPAFCAGCPHGTSTRLPDGSFATAGIGCHFMALDHSDATRTFTHMGGEGVTWVGLAPFTGTKHVFANLGDGTYTHSGILAIRQAVAAGTAITYKILVNDAVAMTGGQPAEGGFTVPQIAAQVAAEGVKRIAIVADEAERLPPASALPAGATRHTREDLDAVQRDLREYPGVSALIYDQVCATEKRRRRKRGKLAEAARSVQINPDVCENCGDCSVQSACIAIEPVDTPLGRKRRISPTACNVDLSCLKGFCPSFVTVAGPPRAPDADPHWANLEQELAEPLPAPAPPHRSPWRALFAGIGGGGIVTAGKILAMAAHLEGREVRTLDFTGLAQKNGTVVAHVQIGEPDQLDVVRVPLGEADLMIAADLAVGAGPNVLERCGPRTAVVGNLDLAASADFKFDPRLRIDAGLHCRTIDRATDAGQSQYLHAVRIAERLFGNAQAMNTLLLGMAWQKGLIPVSEAAIRRAIELNGAAVKLNLRAFLWGRILAHRPEIADEIVRPAQDAPPADLDALIEDRANRLVAYQGKRYAKRYRDFVAEARAAEAAALGQAGRFTRAVAENLFRVMAYKDEYEVARLHAAATYGEAPVFHLSPPLVRGIDPATGRRRKVAIPGRVALPLFRVLRHGKHLRGTKLDLFGRQAERRWERALIGDYMADMRTAMAALRPQTLATAIALATLPDEIRGFGPVKEANRAKAMERRQALLAKFCAPEREAVAVAAE